MNAYTGKILGISDSVWSAVATARPFPWCAPTSLKPAAGDLPRAFLTE